MLYMKTGGNVDKYFKSACAPSQPWFTTKRLHARLSMAELIILLQASTESLVLRRWSLYTEEVFGSSSLLTFILFWTLGYNIVYLF